MVMRILKLATKYKYININLLASWQNVKFW